MEKYFTVFQGHTGPATHAATTSAKAFALPTHTLLVIFPRAYNGLLPTPLPDVLLRPTLLCCRTSVQITNLRLANAHFGCLLSWACNNGWYSALFYFSILEMSKKPNDSILGCTQSSKGHLESGLMLATALFYGLLKDTFPKSLSIGQTFPKLSLHWEPTFHFHVREVLRSQRPTHVWKGDFEIRESEDRWGGKGPLEII